MKVFQVHISGGCYDEYYDYIESSYLDRTKAETRIKELQDEYFEQVVQAQICENCYSCNKDCYIPEVDEFDDEWCKNFVDYPNHYYDNEQYTIEEVDVIE